jgi:hypothetical protein
VQENLWFFGRALAAPAGESLVVDAKVRQDQEPGRDLGQPQKPRAAQANVPVVRARVPVHLRAGVVGLVAGPDLVPRDKPDVLLAGGVQVKPDALAVQIRALGQALLRAGQPGQQEQEGEGSFCHGAGRRATPATLPDKIGPWPRQKR